MKDVETAFRKHYKELCLFAMSYVQEPEAAEDVVQDVFVRLLTKKKDILAIKYPRAYLYNATKNGCLNYLEKLKRNQKKKELFQEQMSQTESVEEAMHKADRKMEIYKAVDSLPNQCRKIFIMCNLYELKYKEAAEELDISINSIKTQMKKAYKLLRKALKDSSSLFI